MLYIVPKFKKIFADFGTELPPITQALLGVSDWVINYFYVIPGIPVAIFLWVKMWRKFRFGRIGWDLFTLQAPVFGAIIQKTVLARTTRTLGTLVASGVPILEALNIAKETSGNAVFENMYSKVYDSVREGESIAQPMREHSRPGFNSMALFFWLNPAMVITIILAVGMPDVPEAATLTGGGLALICGLFYMMKMKSRVVDDIVVNMVDVGEETGELDKMLYKVADVYDEEVDVAVESLVSLLEPLMIVILGLMVGFIVIALFMPLISLIEKLS
jgi:type IV pilus assembly protein PilC